MALEQIFKDVSPEVSDVREIVDGRPARVELHLLASFVQWTKLLQLTRVGVEETKGHLSGIARFAAGQREARARTQLLEPQPQRAPAIPLITNQSFCALLRRYLWPKTCQRSACIFSSRQR